MRYSFFLGAFALISCTTSQPTPRTAVIDGIPVYGKTHEISELSIRQAIAVDRSTPRQPESRICALDIASKMEVHVYHTRYGGTVWDYDVLKFKHGKWQWKDRVVVGASRI
jgi:hypothetical protein